MTRLPNLLEGLKYSALNGFFFVLSKLIRGLAVPKLLDPAAYGLFSSIGLFTRYLNFSDLGAVAYFTKEIPKAHFAAQTDQVRSLINQTFSVLVVGMAVPAFILLVIAASYNGEQSDFYRLALILLIPIYVFGKIRELFVSYLYGIGSYRTNAVLSTVANYVGLLFVITGVYSNGAIGGVFAMVASEALLLILVIKSAKIKLEWDLQFSIVKRAKCYLTQFLLQLTETVSVTADQVILLFIFGPVGFGVYAFGLTFAWLFEAISEVYNTAFYPKIMASSLISEDRALNEMQRALLTYLVTSIAALPGAIISLEWLIETFFKQYEKGLDVFFLILFLGISRGSLALLKKGYLVTNNERRYINICLYSMSATALSGASAWAAGFSFREILVFLVAINVASYLLFYVNLIGLRLQYYFLNVSFFLFGFGLVGLYQAQRTEIISSVDVSSLLFSGVIAYCLVGLVAWRAKPALVRWLEI